MKARDFAYRKAATVTEAVNLLCERDGGAVVLAGGQSLLAGLNLRLSAPELLVDITGLAELQGISLDCEVVRIGALTRHVDLMNSGLIAQHLPLLAEAVTWIAHPGIRNRGTIGGSVAYADPSAELPACILALGAEIAVIGAAGERRIRAGDFFEGLFATALQSGEIITEFRIPRQTAHGRWAFLELSRRRGDFAMAGIAMVATVDDEDVVTDARLVYFGCTDRPFLASKISAQLVGHQLSEAPLEAMLGAVANDLELDDTPGFRADTKMSYARTLTQRALTQMRDR